MLYSNKTNTDLLGIGPEPTIPSPYVAGVSALLASPTTAFEIAEAGLRVNTCQESYYRAPAIDNTPLVRMSYNARASLRSQIESMRQATDAPAQEAALRLATQVAILRGDADRLQPARRGSVQPLPFTVSA